MSSRKMIRRRQIHRCRPWVRWDQWDLVDRLDLADRWLLLHRWHQLHQLHQCRLWVRWAQSVLVDRLRRWRLVDQWVLVDPSHQLLRLVHRRRLLQRVLADRRPRLVQRVLAVRRPRWRRFLRSDHTLPDRPFLLAVRRHPGDLVQPGSSPLPMGYPTRCSSGAVMGSLARWSTNQRPQIQQHQRRTRSQVQSTPAVSRAAAKAPSDLTEQRRARRMTSR